MVERRRERELGWGRPGSWSDCVMNNEYGVAGLGGEVVVMGALLGFLGVVGVVLAPQL